MRTLSTHMMRASNYANTLTAGQVPKRLAFFRTKQRRTVSEKRKPRLDFQ